MLSVSSGNLFLGLGRHLCGATERKFVVDCFLTWSDDRLWFQTVSRSSCDLLVSLSTLLEVLPVLFISPLHEDFGSLLMLILRT